MAAASGCYLLAVVAEPVTEEDKQIILQRFNKGLLSWDVSSTGCDLKSLENVCSNVKEKGCADSDASMLIQYSTEGLGVEVLVNPTVSTLKQCVKNLLTSTISHKHIIHSGYTFTGSGSWILQNGSYSFDELLTSFQDPLVHREKTCTIHVHCDEEGEWTNANFSKDVFSKVAKVSLNPPDKIDHLPGSEKLVDCLESVLKVHSLTEMMESSSLVGNIRFNRPTLYVFPAGQGDCALFGINGFNMLVDAGFNRKPCAWEFIRHLDRLDAVLCTRLSESNLCSMSTLMKRKTLNSTYPQIGYVFCNIAEGKEASPVEEIQKDKNKLLVSVVGEGHNFIRTLNDLTLVPHQCWRDSTEPFVLYHKVGHGTLEMYVLSPPKDSKEIKDFLMEWSSYKEKFSCVKSDVKNKGREALIPLSHATSICAIAVWRPNNPKDTITRILFPGSAPQSRIFEGLEKLKNLDILKHPKVTKASLSAVVLAKPKVKSSSTLTKAAPPNRKNTASPALSASSVASKNGDIAGTKKEINKINKEIKKVTKESKKDVKTVKEVKKEVKKEIVKKEVKESKPVAEKKTAAKTAAKKIEAVPKSSPDAKKTASPVKKAAKKETAGKLSTTTKNAEKVEVKKPTAKIVETKTVKEVTNKKAAEAKTAAKPKAKLPAAGTTKSPVKTKTPASKSPSKLSRAIAGSAAIATAAVTVGVAELINTKQAEVEKEEEILQVEITEEPGKFVPESMQNGVPEVDIQENEIPSPNRQEVASPALSEPVSLTASDTLSSAPMETVSPTPPIQEMLSPAEEKDVNEVKEIADLQTPSLDDDVLGAPETQFVGRQNIADEGVVEDTEGLDKVNQHVLEEENVADAEVVCSNEMMATSFIGDSLEPHVADKATVDGAYFEKIHTEDANAEKDVLGDEEIENQQYVQKANFSEHVLEPNENEGKNDMLNENDINKQFAMASMEGSFCAGMMPSNTEELERNIYDQHENLESYDNMKEISEDIQNIPDFKNDESKFYEKCVTGSIAEVHSTQIHETYEQVEVTKDISDFDRDIGEVVSAPKSEPEDENTAIENDLMKGYEIPRKSPTAYMDEKENTSYEIESEQFQSSHILESSIKQGHSEIDQNEFVESERDYMIQVPVHETENVEREKYELEASGEELKVNAKGLEESSHIEMKTEFVEFRNSMNEEQDLEDIDRRESVVESEDDVDLHHYMAKAPVDEGKLSANISSRDSDSDNEDVVKSPTPHAVVDYGGPLDNTNDKVDGNVFTTSEFASKVEEKEDNINENYPSEQKQNLEEKDRDSAEDEEEMIRHPTPPGGQAFYKQVGPNDDLNRDPITQHYVVPPAFVTKGPSAPVEPLYEESEDSGSERSQSPVEEQPIFSSTDKADFPELVTLSGGTTPSEPQSPKSPLDTRKGNIAALDVMEALSEHDCSESSNLSPVTRDGPQSFDTEATKYEHDEHLSSLTGHEEQHKLTEDNVDINEKAECDIHEKLESDTCSEISQQMQVEYSYEASSEAHLYSEEKHETRDSHLPSEPYLEQTSDLINRPESDQHFGIPSDFQDHQVEEKYSVKEESIANFESETYSTFSQDPCPQPVSDSVDVSDVLDSDKNVIGSDVKGASHYSEVTYEQSSSIEHFSHETSALLHTYDSEKVTLGDNGFVPETMLGETGSTYDSGIGKVQTEIKSDDYFTKADSSEYVKDNSKFADNIDPPPARFSDGMAESSVREQSYPNGFSNVDPPAYDDGISGLNTSHSSLPAAGVNGDDNNSWKSYENDIPEPSYPGDANSKSSDVSSSKMASGGQQMPYITDSHYQSDSPEDNSMRNDSPSDIPSPIDPETLPDPLNSLSVGVPPAYEDINNKFLQTGDENIPENMNYMNVIPPSGKGNYGREIVDPYGESSEDDDDSSSLPGNVSPYAYTNKAYTQEEEDADGNHIYKPGFPLEQSSEKTLFDGNNPHSENPTAHHVSPGMTYSPGFPDMQATDPNYDFRLEEWGKPMGLPTPPEPTVKTAKKPVKPSAVSNKVLSKSSDKRPSLDNGKPPGVTSKLTSSPVKKPKDTAGSELKPVYVDLAYVPHHGDMNYSDVEFFKKVRARYYVFSGINPSREVLNALLEAKKSWKEDLEVTIIPTYETDTLGYWMAQNQDVLAEYSIEVAPSASRCTVNLQDHETSCAAYRLEF